MTKCFMACWLVLFIVLIGQYPTQLDAVMTRQLTTGCLHNGTRYADKSLVPTTAKCLSCACNKKHLVCRLKVCPEMPMPPPRGCVVVQKKNTCCPYLSCARLDAFYKIPTSSRIIAYLDHYERESIDRVVSENMLQRRSDDYDVDLFVCIKNGTVYKSGSAMSSSNLCSYCYCIGGTEKCVKPKCMLPIEGCKPIFVDSTCCPVRYDCNVKASGKSSQESRYRKTSNKHFLRMSQRLQRNHGCMAGKHFYMEGQKMKSDADRPCDVCFCIRGTRRCAPKKCAPALKNCMPVVPKGQCCPSSYDCGSQRDYRRAETSRQFNLFSLIFGPDEGESEGANMAAQYPHDRQPIVAANKKNLTQLSVAATSEKTIFDTLREGLEFIDQNNQLLQDEIQFTPNNPLETMAAAVITTTTTMKPNVTDNITATTEVSLLELLLGSADEPEGILTEAPINKKTIITSSTESVSWVDLLLGPDDVGDETAIGNTTENLDLDSSTYTPEKSASTTLHLNIERSDDHEIDGSGQISAGELFVGDLNEVTKIDDSTETVETTTSQLSSIVEEISTETTFVGEEVTMTTEIPSTTDTNTIDYTEQLTKGPTPVINMAVAAKENLQKHNRHKNDSQSFGGPNHSDQGLPVNHTIPQKPSNGGLLSALIDGITGILKSEKLSNKMTEVNKPISTIEPAQKPMSSNNALITNTTHTLPMFKPLPTHKTHIRINSKITNLTSEPFLASTNQPTTNSTITTTKVHNQLIANTTVRPSVACAQHLQSATTTTTSPNNINGIASSSSTASINTALLNKHLNKMHQPVPANENFHKKIPLALNGFSSTTSKSSIFVKTNPTILEAEPLDAINDPTLPPSLPNLKIIPFLPTDAVQADRKQPYEFYHSISKSDNAPSLTVGSSSVTSSLLVEDGRWDTLAGDKLTKIEYADAYDEDKIYPSITIKPYQTYSEFPDPSKAEYIYKFKVEGPPPLNEDKTSKSTTSPLFVKFDFGGNQKVVDGVGGGEAGGVGGGFSPPTKTEGGFVPKEPMVIMNNDNPSVGYQVTPHIIDITTSEPMKESSTKVIEITTPDPFKDVIKTELPPDLLSLIEDKEKILSSQKKYSIIPNFTERNEELIVHITTGLPQDLNNSILSNQNDVSIAPEALDDLAEKDKNSIESFFDLLFKEDEFNPPNLYPYASKITKAAATAPTVAATVATSTTKATTTIMPPFKALPQISIITNFNTMHSNTTTTFKPKPVMTVKNIATTQKSFATSTRSQSKTKTTTIKPSIENFVNMDVTQSPLKMPANHLSSSRNNLNSTKAPAVLAKTSATTLKIISESASPTRTTGGSTSNANTSRPLLKAPFDKLPFMDASIQVRPKITPSIGPPKKPSKNSSNKIDGLQANYSEVESNTPKKYLKQSTSTTTKATTAAATATKSLSTISVMESSKNISLMNTTPPLSTSSQHSVVNSLIDPSGILKLAGCNIYGRMYRVGRIILELSSDCLECKCTEVGVKCGTLDC